LSPAVAGRFSSFGRTLRDDELVVVAGAGQREGALYDRRVRRTILVRSQGTYEEDVDLIGVVRETDVDQDSFEIRLADDRRIPVRASRPFLKQIVQSLQRSLKGLTDGWLDGDGRAFDGAALAWSAKLLTGIVNGFDLATPHIYPTPDGSVRAEWSRPRWEISAELDSSRKLSEVRAVRLDANEVHERSFSARRAGARGVARELSRKPTARG